MASIEQMEVSLNEKEQEEIHKNVNKSKKLKEEKVKWKKCKKLFPCPGLAIIGFIIIVIIVLVVLLYNSKKENKQLVKRINNPNLYNIKMPFAINIDNNANLKKCIEEGLVSFPLTNSNKIISEIYDSTHTKVLFFDNLNDLNKSKWINLSEEINVQDYEGKSTNNTLFF